MITLKTLQDKQACRDGIAYFEGLNKTEWNLLELMERCITDGNQSYADWLFCTITTQETFNSDVEHHK